MNSINKTKLYFTYNNIPKYLEFNCYIPETEDSPYGNLWGLLEKNEEYKFCRDDGPSVEYNFGPRIWKSSKCEKYFWGSYKLNSWAQNTNHLLCKICYDFCKQECFI